jgi:hypothetical protein
MDSIMGDIPKFDQLAPMQLAVPLMTRESFAAAIGLPASVFIAQADRGYWPIMKIGKRVFVNVELVRKRALDAEFK